MDDWTVEGLVLSVKRFRIIKPEIRVLGVDDGAFVSRTGGLVPVVGVVFRGGYWLDGVMHTHVRVDGMDGTRKVASMILTSPHHKQLRVVMLNGLTFAGFNVIDIQTLSEKTKLPVIAVTRDKPNITEVRQALKNLPKSEERWNVMEKAGEILDVHSRSGKEKVYMQVSGILDDDARKIVQLTSTRSNIPEALRVAHLIASGVSFA